MCDSHYTQVLQGPPIIASEYFAWPISFIYTHIYGPYMFIYEGQLDVYLFQMPITTSSTLQISTMHMLAIPYAHLQSAAHHKAKISKVLNSHIQAWNRSIAFWPFQVFAIEGLSTSLNCNSDLPTDPLSALHRLRAPRTGGCLYQWVSLLVRLNGSALQWLLPVLGAERITKAHCIVHSAHSIVHSAHCTVHSALDRFEFECSVQ